MQSAVLVRNYSICCEGERQVGGTAMTLVLRAKVCVLECLLSKRWKYFGESDRTWRHENFCKWVRGGLGQGL